MRDELERFRTKTKVPAVIGAVTDADELLGIDVVGSRSRTNPTDLATIDDQWHIGSCTKAITAVLFARLVEEGLAEWGTPLANLFPDLDGADTGWTKVTIDDLLVCRAGVPANPPGSDMMRLHKWEAPPTEQRTQTTNDILREAPKKPGEFLYSNLGYIMAGAAIDRLASTSFEDALTTYVWEPLGITSAGVGAPPDVLGHPAKLPIGPLSAGLGNPAEDLSMADNPTVFTPAGRYHMAIGDWARFQRVFLKNGEPLISSRSIERLLSTPDGPKGKSMSMGWIPAGAAGATHGQQGSNTMWAATALMDLKSGHTAMVVTNDGRSKAISGTVEVARTILFRHR